MNAVTKPESCAFDLDNPSVLSLCIVTLIELHRIRYHLGMPPETNEAAGLAEDEIDRARELLDIKMASLQSYRAGELPRPKKKAPWC